MKPVETGVLDTSSGDASEAAGFAESSGCVEHYTLRAFQAPIAPLESAALEGRTFELDGVLEDLGRLPQADVRLIEGAGGLAVPLSQSGLDWSDLAVRLSVDGSVIVVADRLGAINQGRLCSKYSVSKGLRHGLWLNAVFPVGHEVGKSTRLSFRREGIELVGESDVDRRSEMKINRSWFGL